MNTLRIKEICKERGLALGTLAELIGISKTSTSAIINGRMKPSYDTIIRLSEVLNVPVGELFDAPTENNPVCPHCGKPIKLTKL